jgi:hypothetical protein
MWLRSQARSAQGTPMWLRSQARSAQGSRIASYEVLPMPRNLAVSAVSSAPSTVKATP